MGRSLPTRKHRLDGKPGKPFRKPKTDMDVLVGQAIEDGSSRNKKKIRKSIRRYKGNSLSVRNIDLLRCGSTVTGILKKEV